MNCSITCIAKSDRYNPYERILRVGGVDANGARFTATQVEVIRAIDSGQRRFFVAKGDEPVEVVTSTSPYGNKYIRTTADDSMPNNLLSLPEC